METQIFVFIFALFSFCAKWGEKFHPVKISTFTVLVFGGKNAALSEVQDNKKLNVFNYLVAIIVEHL